MSYLENPLKFRKTFHEFPLLMLFPGITYVKMTVLQAEKYEDIYFDSDEEDGENRKVKTNDELFYDPDMDDDDQTWVDDVR
jgi:hypothetical protein